jgi:hypothetical protein
VIVLNLLQLRLPHLNQKATDPKQELQKSLSLLSNLNRQLTKKFLGYRVMVLTIE